ncbi:sigma-70 family RNA polymerase sigma factor [Marilutibacter maris]|nr:sigma-70 family RNA polymerase sigma factor [Lysobacter maris]
MSPEQPTAGAPRSGDHRDRPVDAVPWERLMEQAQDGDRVAYHTLLQSITPYVRAIARRHLGPGEDTEDAVQEILMIVHGIRHTYERGRPFKPWLGTIASRRCIDLLRKRAHRLRHEFDDFDAVPEHLWGAPGDNAATPMDEASRAQSAREVHEAVEALPERQREAVRLLRLKELSLSEAAEFSEQSTGALKVAYHRALKSLRKALGHSDEAPPEARDDDTGRGPGITPSNTTGHRHD